MSNKYYVCNSGVWNKNLSSIYLYVVVEVMAKIAEKKSVDWEESGYLGEMPAFKVK